MQRRFICALTSKRASPDPMAIGNPGSPFFSQVWDCPITIQKSTVLGGELRFMPW